MVFGNGLTVNFELGVAGFHTSDLLPRCQSEGSSSCPRKVLQVHIRRRLRSAFIASSSRTSFLIPGLRSQLTAALLTVISRKRLQIILTERPRRWLSFVSLALTLFLSIIIIPPLNFSFSKSLVSGKFRVVQLPYAVRLHPKRP